MCCRAAAHRRRVCFPSCLTQPTEMRNAMLSITTTKTANKSGAGRIVAKGAGKQMTLPYDHAKSANAQHGEAAAALALKIHPEGFKVDTVGAARHEDKGNGKHVFIIG